jgi:CheY-like chemotaxis protein
VILCDLLMPRMDGLAFAIHLRPNPEWAEIPIVAVTALGEAVDYIRTWAHGFAGHLVKPIDHAQLADTIRRVIRRRSRRGGITRHPGIR